MSTIFISYTGRDSGGEGRLWAERIHALLVELHYQDVFLDRHSSDGITVGTDWRQLLHQQLGRCAALVAICSDAYERSAWCMAELAVAIHAGKLLIPINVQTPVVDAAGRLQPPPLPLLLQHLQAIQPLEQPLTVISPNLEQGAPLEPRLDDVAERLGRALEQGLSWRARLPWPPPELRNGDDPVSPYPGLETFERWHAPVFFGQDTVLEQLRLRLQRLSPNDSRLLLILGASGCGKSSLLRAGLLPLLEQQAGSRRWLLLEPFKPEDDPFGGLTAVLDRFGATLQPPLPPLAAPLRTAQELVQHLRLLRRSAGRDRASVVIPIDQFEELLGWSRSASTEAGTAQADAFLQMLAELLAMDYSQVLVVATLRSDFLGTFQLHASELVRWSIGPADDFTTQLVPLDKGGFRQVIEGPARMAALPLEPGFSEQLVHDIPHGDALPLLAFTLQELWELRPSGGALSLELYQQHGGIDGAVKRAVDRALKGEKDLAVLREAFLGHLLRLSDDGQVAKQTALWDELPPRSRPLLERLVGGRLLVSRLVKSPEPAAPLRTLEIAHEALLRTWPTLVEWIKEGTEELLQRRRVKRLADDLKPAAAERQRRQALAQLAALAAAGGSEQLAVRKEAADPLAQLLAEATVPAPLADREDAALVLALIGAEEPLRVCLADTVAPVALRRRAAESLGLLARRSGEQSQRERIADVLKDLQLNSKALDVRIEVELEYSTLDPAIVQGLVEQTGRQVHEGMQQMMNAGQLPPDLGEDQLQEIFQQNVDRIVVEQLQQELWASGQAAGWKEHDEQLPLLQGLSRGLQLAVAPDLPLLGDGPGQMVPMLTLTALEEGEGLHIRTEVVEVPVWRLPLPGGEQLELVLVRAGTYEIGSPEGEDGRTGYATFRSRCDPSEVDVEAQRRVQLRTFAMVRQPISQGQWRAVVEALPAEARGTLKPGPGTFRGEDQWERFGQPGGLPVDSVNWNAAVEWLQALNGWLAEQWPAWAAQHPGIGATPAQLALPSESQWEAACRGAADPPTPFHFGATLDPSWARYDPSYTYGKGRRGEYLQRPVPIGFFGLVNTHGLAELHGQLLEWCGDQWHRDPVAGAPPEGGSMGGADPGLAGDKEQRYRLLRGGSWFLGPINCRAASRYGNYPAYVDSVNGVRPCCLLPPGSLLGA